MHLCQIIFISGNYTSPETDVNVKLASSSSDLHFERLTRGRGRNAVERHLDNRSHAASRGRDGRGLESFPLRSAWLVDMHTCIDDAGHDDGIAIVESVR